MDRYDLVIRNGKLVDPEKYQFSSGAIGVKNGKIAVITAGEIYGKVEIDADGQFVSPGFIDVHSHIDGHREFAELALVQGVTTAVGGNCGLSPINLQEFFSTEDQLGFPIHQAQLIGHSFTLRQRVGAMDPFLPASAQQIRQMVDLTEKALADGAIGLSFGLEYAPGTSFEEIIALSQVAAKHGRLIAIHTRMLACGDLASLTEAINISLITGARVLISHFVYQYGCGLMSKALSIVDQARHDGIDVWIDSGLYTAFASFVGTPVFSERYMTEFGWKPEDLMAATGKYCGRRLTSQTYQDMRANYPNDSVICFTGNETDIDEPFKHDYTMVSSDIGPTPTGSTREGHPQNTGTFPRFFRKLVREKQILSVVDAVVKCTLLPAQTFGLNTKGRLKEGADADLVIWNIDKINDCADFPGIGRPDAPPEGIAYVIVNGQIAAKDNHIQKEVLSGKTIQPQSIADHKLSQVG